ncbi:hypothetical protein M501DRAFT_1010975 [Patellaria atrata CBS 101060]|uniref:MFS maltose permease n=1 Tax=Patellaria atrata CBS 101060 TaxID=1346257 RepID=A0A9P4SCB2_9PEZI|nr:hypothetical protein M501DRAFT_1010975 [Patellaria atrata CBS 101060]
MAEHSVLLPPPNKASPLSSLRPFTQRTRLLLLTPTTLRPQLPFLSPGTQSFPTQGGQLRLTRLLTTERKRYFKEQAWLTGKYTFFSFSCIFLFSLLSYGVKNEILERKYPSPSEWRMKTRALWRQGHHEEAPAPDGSKMIDWAKLSGNWITILRRLEDLEHEGKGLVEQEEGSVLIPGLGRAGYNIEAKDYEWKDGYFKVIMGCAKCAEHLDGMVVDTTRHWVLDPAHVVGPSNPHPKPLPPFSKRIEPPLEENCEPAFEPPEAFYMRVLTSKGFTTRQRVDAALAYADWLDFKGLHDTAEEMYKWSLDIAVSALPDPSSLFKKDSLVINTEAKTVSENVLRVVTQTATHYAQKGDTSTSLPIYLSVLRARRSAPVVLVNDESENKEPSPYSSVGAFLKQPSYPPPPPSYDTPITRNPSDPCEEATLMTFIGEILFSMSSSSSRQREVGLGWTRKAVEAAETSLREQSLPDASKKKCIECVEVGLKNWGDDTQTIGSGRWKSEQINIERKIQTFYREKYQQSMVATGPQNIIEKLII